MKTLQSKLLVLLLSTSLLCCKKDDAVKSTPTAAVPNTITFKGNNITFNGLSIDSEYPDSTSEYIFSTLSNLSMVLYCKYINVVGPDPAQASADGIVTYNADEADYFPVNNYPELTVRGYINYDGLLYKSVSGSIKIKRNDLGNQTFQFENLKFKVGDEEQLLNGTINLTKS